MGGVADGGELRIEGPATRQASDLFLGPILQGWDFSYISCTVTPLLVTAAAAV